MPLIGTFGAGSKGGYGRGGGKAPYNVDFLITGGGGGGGFYVGGGGGAGGYVAGTDKLLTIGETYTVTVGAPGPDSGGPTPYHQGGNGGNSALTGETTAVGGGAGGGGYGGAGGAGGFPGQPGGSGGGGGGNQVPPVTGGSGTAGQGNPGGGGGGFPGTGGGGGGAGSAGTPGSYGSGTANSITGSSIYYCGGGPSNGGAYNPTGSSGPPYSPPWDTQKSDPNYFGGRGHGGYPDKYAGASGGVYLRMLTKDYNSDGVTGSNVTSTDGDYTIIQFTGSGSYVA